MKSVQRTKLQPKPAPKREVTKPRAAERPASLADQRRAWQHQADQIADLFADEHAPAELTKYLEEGYTETVNSIRNCFDHPEVIRVAWPLILELRATGDIERRSASVANTPALGSFGQVFEQFADAVNAVLDHPDTPADIFRVVTLAIDEIGNLYQVNEPPDYNNRVLGRVSAMVAGKDGESR